MFVTLDNIRVDKTDYTINYVNDTITFTTAPTTGKVLSIVGLGVSGQKILDINKFVADGSTNTIQQILNIQQM